MRQLVCHALTDPRANQHRNRIQNAESDEIR
jgi:hypothetical protein